MGPSTSRLKIHEAFLRVTRGCEEWTGESHRRERTGYMQAALSGPVKQSLEEATCTSDCPAGESLVTQGRNKLV